MASTMKTAIITLPNRSILSNEYHSNYGHGSSHVQVLKKHLTFSQKAQATFTEEIKGENLLVTISYMGNLSKRNKEEIYDFFQCGFISDISY